MNPLENYEPRPLPGKQTLTGRLVRLEPYKEEVHGAGLGDAIGGEENADLWTYMPFNAMPGGEAFGPVFSETASKRDWIPYVILNRATRAVLGMASYMRQRPEHGSIEVGCVAFSKALQKTPAATEAMFLMAMHVIEDLGYRRYEWKCHNLNKASKRAAVRFGFQFEGIFRNDMVMKGSNRDTAWFAMTDDDWPLIRADFEHWLSPSNFMADGHQKLSLSALRARHSQQQQQQQQ